MLARHEAYASCAPDELALAIFLRVVETEHDHLDGITARIFAAN